jgi:3alpha(or 20beta)-hydroxysteroid dehydrogenase
VAQGYGAETARLFHREGAKVVIADMLMEEGAALAEELGDTAIFHQTDVSKSEDGHALLELRKTRFGTPNILVNNAAIQRFSSILECEDDEFFNVLDINLIGAFRGLKIIGGEMVRNGLGSIVNISSVDGLRGANGYAAYSASKWGVRGLTKVAALEFGPRGVRVNSVHPGGILTVMGNPGELSVEDADKTMNKVPLQRLGRVHEVAKASLFLASDEASYVCGAEVVVDGGWSAGVYNEGLSGEPADENYGTRDGQHPVSAHPNTRLRGWSAVS